MRKERTKRKPVSSTNNTENNRNGIRLWAVLVWLVIWEIAARILNMELFLASPIRVLTRLFELVREPAFWESMGNSSLRIIGGYLLAVALGLLLASLASHFKRLRELLAPLMLTIKSVPVASFIILALIFFSSRHLAVLISFLMALPIIYTNVLEGIGATDEKLLEMAQVYRMPKLRKFRYITMVQIAPYLASACSIACGLAWKAGIAAEVIGMPKRSIGEQLQQAKVYLNTRDLLAWTVMIVILSLIFERLIRLLLKGVSALVLSAGTGRSAG